MDATGFFQYPTGDQPNLEPPRNRPRPEESHAAIPAMAPAAAREDPVPQGFLADRTEDEWARLLEHTTTIRFRPGDTILRAGAEDRAFYLLLAGRVEVVGDEGWVIDAPAELGDAAFFDGLPRAVSVRALAAGEAIRMSWEAFEALGVRHPRLALAVLSDLGRLAAARQRASIGGVAGFTG